MAQLRRASALTIGARATAELLERYGLRPDKRLGQHFLVDPNQVERIVRLAGVEAGDHVIEVGPGLGALTRGLLEAGCRVTAVEVDRGLVELLRAEITADALTVVHADALDVDWSAVADPAHRWSMVANLPYNVATPLVLDVLDLVPQIQRLLVMVQREVAERFVAPPRSSNYGVPSVKVAWWGSGEVVARVPASVFLPPPRVESALVRIDRSPEPAFTQAVDDVFDLVRAAFGQRRKMLRRSLATKIDAAMFTAAGIEPTQRPEELDVADWARLSQARADLGVGRDG